MTTKVIFIAAYMCFIQRITSVSGTTTTVGRNDCGRLPNPANGAIKYARNVTSFGSSASYSCQPGFEMIGPEVIHCEAQGNWSSDTTYCQIKDCGILTNPLNGKVYVSNGTTYQSVGKYRCNTGYTLYGDNSTICKEEGNWTVHSVNCKINDCLHPNHPVNGSVNIKNGTTYGSMVTFDCNTGYDLKGAKHAVCLSNSSWDVPSPFCIIRENVIIALETRVYPFRGDDQLIDAKPIHNRFPYFGVEYNSYRPNMNGFLTLGYQPLFEAYGPETPTDWQKFSRGYTVIAPFWTNIDSTNLAGGLYVHTFEYYTNYGRNNSQHRDLSHLGNIFSDYLNIIDFTPRIALVATWHNVTKSSSLEPGRLIKTQNATMQVILISDGIYSYAMFNYDQEQWSLKMDKNIHSSAGFSLRDKTGFIIATSKNISQLNKGTNVNPGLKGRWIYNVSSTDPDVVAVLRNESECLAFSQNDTIRHWITTQRALSYPCPCSEQQMQLDYNYRTVDPMYKDSQTKMVCYEAWFFNNDGVKQTCCYSYGALKKDNTGGGFATFEKDPYDTIEYFYACCKEKTHRHLCHLFYEMNPSDDCSRFQPADEPVGRNKRSWWEKVQTR